MSQLEIIQIGHPTLRTKAQPVRQEQFSSPEIKKLISEMKQSLQAEDGLGLAANQVNHRVQIIAVRIPPELIGPESVGIPLQILVNPEITDRSEDLEEDWEGCLSIKPLVGLVPRHRNVVVQALNEKGEKITIEAHGLFSRVLQHEIDHLRGVLFIDRISDLKTLMNENEFKRLNQDETLVIE